MPGRSSVAGLGPLTAVDVVSALGGVAGAGAVASVSPAARGAGARGHGKGAVDVVRSVGNPDVDALEDCEAPQATTRTSEATVAASLACRAVDRVATRGPTGGRGPTGWGSADTARCSAHRPHKDERSRRRGRLEVPRVRTPRATVRIATSRREYRRLVVAARSTDIGWIAAAAAKVDAWWDRLVSPPSGPEDPAFPWRRHILTAVGIVGYAGLDAARRSLDAALSKVHPAESRGFSANDLHGGRSIANRALDAWEAGSREFDRFLLWSGRSLATIDTLIELVLIPFSAVLLYSIIRFLRNELQRADDAMDEEQSSRRQRSVPPWRTAPHHAVLRICTLAVVVYLILGLLNQFLEFAILFRDTADVATAVPLQVGHYVRRGALILTLIPAAITAMMLARNYWHPIARIREAGSAYRILGLLAGLHFVLLLLSVPAEQGRDAIRLWPERGWLAVWGVLATVGFSLALATLALRLSTLRRPGGDILGMVGTVGLTGAGMVIALLGLALHHWASWGNGVTALGIVLIVVGVLSVPILSAVGDHMPGRQRDEPSAQTQVVVPAILAMTPLLALAMATIEAGTPELITSTSAWWLVLIAVIVSALAIFAYVAARWYGERAYRATRDRAHRAGRRRAFAAATGGLLIGSLVVAGWVIADPWGHGAGIGVHGQLGSFLVLTTVVIGSIGYVVEGRSMPASLDFVGLRRIPLVTALIVWGVVGNALPDDDYHAIRVMENQPEAERGVTVEQAFDRWVAANAPGVAPVAAAEGGGRTVPGVPMVFVTAAGGGIRAATFTSYALECLFSDIDPVACIGDDDFVDPDSWSNVFMASGASGGSVGIASVAATRAAGPDPDADWIATRLGTDLLSPELGWQLFVEVPNTLLTFNPGLERAEVLERTWERRFGDELEGPAAQAFLAPTAAEQGSAPLLFLNGTNLPDGCRVNISSARTTGGGAATDPARPGTTARDDCRRRRLDDPAETLDQIVARDLADYLCADEDVALSTAAFLSSRFPLVAPTGIVPDLKDRRPDCPTASTTGELSIGDAGYRDNSGASAVADVWSQLDPMVAEFNRTHDVCVVPLLVEIDNGHRSQRAFTPPEPSIQLTAPLQGALGVFSSRDAGPIEAMAAEFSRELGPDIVINVDGAAAAPRFARLSLFEHPGVLAPLGWSLSRAAVRDLQSQLDDVVQNQQTVERIGSWLAPGSLTCTIDE